MRAVDALRDDQQRLQLVAADARRSPTGASARTASGRRAGSAAGPRGSVAMCQKTWHSSPFRSGDVTIVSRISGRDAARHTQEPQQAMRRREQRVVGDVRRRSRRARRPRATAGAGSRRTPRAFAVPSCVLLVRCCTRGDGAGEHAVDERGVGRRGCLRAARPWSRRTARPRTGSAGRRAGTRCRRSCTCEITANAVSFGSSGSNTPGAGRRRSSTPTTIASYASRLPTASSSRSPVRLRSSVSPRVASRGRSACSATWWTTSAASWSAGALVIGDRLADAVGEQRPWSSRSARTGSAPCRGSGSRCWRPDVERVGDLPHRRRLVALLEEAVGARALARSRCGSSRRPPRRRLGRRRPPSQPVDLAVGVAGQGVDDDRTGPAPRSRRCARAGRARRLLGHEGRAGALDHAGHDALLAVVGHADHGRLGDALERAELRASTRLAWIFSPPRTITSAMRPCSVRNPSPSTPPRSPVRSHGPRNTSAVAASFASSPASASGPPATPRPVARRRRRRRRRPRRAAAPARPAGPTVSARDTANSGSSSVAERGELGEPVDVERAQRRPAARPAPRSTAGGIGAPP